MSLSSPSLSRLSFLPRIVFAALVGLPFLAAPAAAVEWYDGTGRSCDAVCGKMRQHPVTSGIHTPGGRVTNDQFFVCAADMNGWRGGYNLKPSWANVCMVGYGGKEVRASPYMCACE